MFNSLKNRLGTFLQDLNQKTISEKDIDSILFELELILLQNDVSVKVTEEIKEILGKSLSGKKIGLLNNKKDFIEASLKEAVKEILSSEKIDLIEKIKTKKPFVIMFIGFNGTGKTTTIAKLGNILKKKGFSVVFSASDTFRAGSIEQLERHAKNIGIKVIKHKYGGDPAAVAFDAIKHAKARSIDVVIIDTAGRSETNKNLMAEVKKIKRVVAPDLTIFVGDALAGNSLVNQAEKFNEIGIDCSILTKIDADARGGGALSITSATEKPIVYVGTGQGYDDLEIFDPDWLIRNLF
ncbi:MAG: signal recognition particle-docking protein FtsY [Methanomicrobia archaeon]|nr:signal recognition particle-docking protein FtsY [Methanomicrobia archaeon]